ncbi:HET-domain-containing protein [Xylaria arbuscula]|nr:HET-domain-containing protein [Xylaria arbuscula]
MHLLNVHTRGLQEFFEDRTPPYAILSHTWSEEEVSFQDLDDPKHREKLGYAKIEGCCQQAIRDELDFVWVDTCCIDKRSSAELSEAINSMFGWYGKAHVCYVYLGDVPWEAKPYDPSSAFCKSRWFTRGWTLQELIAPVKLKFFDTAWGMIFEELRDVPLAKKLSWMSERSTTRVEDMAYSLLGLLDVSMPLLYGEGDRAFIRLQEEFLKRYFDPSILLWGVGMDRLAIKKAGGHLKPYGLARTPLLFKWAKHMPLERFSSRLGEPSRGTWALTPHGLRVELQLLCIDACTDAYLCVINYEDSQYIFRNVRCFAMPLQRLKDSDVYQYTCSHRPLLVEIPLGWFNRNISKWKTIYLTANTAGHKYLLDSNWIGISPLPRETFVNVQLLIRYGFRFAGIYPPAKRLAFRDVPLSWVPHTFGRQAVMVMHRDQRETLYLLISYSRWETRCEALVCRSSYRERSSAIEVWDSCRTPRKRIFLDPPQLRWHQALSIDIGNGHVAFVTGLMNHRLVKIFQFQQALRRWGYIHYQAYQTSS